MRLLIEIIDGRKILYEISMEYLWNHLMPFATASIGVCSMFCDVDALIIGHDPKTTAIKSYNRTEITPKIHKVSKPEGDGSAIIIGEQIPSNLLRKEIRDSFTGKVVVASWFSMADEFL